MDEVMSSDNESATKGDLRLLRGELKGDIGALRSDVSQFREEMRELIRPITITLAHHTAELADIRGHIKALEDRRPT